MLNWIRRIFGTTSPVIENDTPVLQVVDEPAPEPAPTVLSVPTVPTAQIALNTPKAKRAKPTRKRSKK